MEQPILLLFAWTIIRKNSRVPLKTKYSKTVGVVRRVLCCKDAETSVLEHCIMAIAIGDLGMIFQNTANRSTSCLGRLSLFLPERCFSVALCHDL